MFYVVPGKEIVVTADVTIPRGTLLYVDARLNVTIPSFTHSMLVELKLHEKTPKDYDVSKINLSYSVTSSMSLNFQTVLVFSRWCNGSAC